MKNYQNIGFSSNTGPDPLKNLSYQASIQCWVIIGTPAKRHLMAFRWRANDGPLIIVLRSSLPSSKKKKFSRLDPLWQNFLDPRMYMYEGCSNMNASSFITFFTYMLRQNAIPFWKDLFVAFKMTPNINKHSLCFLNYRRLYKDHSCILTFFLKQIAKHVLVHVRI